MISSFEMNFPKAGDPCRANARQCIELAEVVKYPQLKETFLELAEK
jgi:hypothetical protein